jgi:hypothetical protein
VDWTVAEIGTVPREYASMAVMSATPTITPGGIPDGKRRRTPASTMLLHEWVTIRYPRALVFYQLRLGPTARQLINVEVTPALEAMLRVANWYADAVILTESEGLMVEAKVEPNPSAIGQALFYLRLYWSTPELAQFSHLPFSPVVLFAESDPAVTDFARSLGVRTEIYTPPWIATYLEQVQFRGRGSRSPAPPGPVENE